MGIVELRLCFHQLSISLGKLIQFDIAGVELLFNKV